MKTSTFIHHEIEKQQRVQPARITSKYNRFGSSERSWKDNSLSRAKVYLGDFVKFFTCIFNILLFLFTHFGYPIIQLL